MNDNTLPYLTKPQRAILSELGISQWQLSSAELCSNDVHSVNITSTVTTDTQSLPEPTPVVSVESIPDQVLLLFPEELAQSRFVKDVLLAINMNDKTITCASNKQLHEYSDYCLAWLPGESLSVTGKLLTTPISALKYDSAAKKQLWSLLISL